MDNARNHALEYAVAGALDWWHEAGIDFTFADDPADWLACAKVTEAAPVAAPAPPENEPRRDFAPRSDVSPLDLASMPANLAAFREWWLSEPSLDEGRTAGRVPPRGVAGAGLMVIVPEPEREDSDRLLSGPQGKLLDAILSAMGIAQERTYVASVLPRHTPAPDWSGMAARGMDEVLARHIALAAPQRILAFDGNILPLLGNAPAQGPAVLRTFNHEGASISLLAVRGLQRLIERSSWKRELWRAWLDWTESDWTG